MKKAVIVFHSVCGNDYLLATRFQSALSQTGMDVTLLRVSDPAWVEKPDLSEQVRVNLRAMRQVSEASAKDLLEADLIVMGSPTYFGNVSAPMKTFMDSTGGLWFQGKLAGKKFVAFTSAGNTEGGGDLCLQSLHTYAKYMGMLTIPVPVNLLPGESLPALGVIHYSSGKYAETLDGRIARFIDALSTYVKAIV